MTIEHAQAIVAAADELGIGVTLRESYSGRGMFGKTTAGVVGSLTDIIKAIAAAAHTAGQLGNDATIDGDAFIADVGNLSMDNMGYDRIVY